MTSQMISKWRKVMSRLFFIEVLHNITVLYTKARCVRISNVLFLLSIFRPLRDIKVIEVFSATRERLLKVFCSYRIKNVCCI